MVPSGKETLNPILLPVIHRHPSVLFQITYSASNIVNYQEDGYHVNPTIEAYLRAQILQILFTRNTCISWYIDWSYSGIQPALPGQGHGQGQGHVWESIIVGGRIIQRRGAYGRTTSSMAVLIPHSLYGLSTPYSIHMYDSVALVHTLWHIWDIQV